MPTLYKFKLRGGDHYEGEKKYVHNDVIETDKDLHGMFDTTAPIGTEKFILIEKKEVGGDHPFFENQRFEQDALANPNARFMSHKNPGGEHKDTDVNPPHRSPDHQVHTTQQAGGANLSEVKGGSETKEGAAAHHKGPVPPSASEGKRK